jgi:hypothetical protein
MGIRTTIVLDEDVLERVREAGLQRVAIPPKAFSMGESRLAFPFRVSDLDAWEEEEEARREV